MNLKYALYLFSIFTVCHLFYACTKSSKKTIQQTEIAFKKEGELSIFNTKNDSLRAKLNIEIADTNFDIQTGLMYRNNMKKSNGMLFVFEDEKERFFYMKNTRIPLDIIFVNTKKHIVSFQENTSPLNEESLPSSVPAKYVLEVNAGLVNHWQLNIGDSLHW